MKPIRVMHVVQSLEVGGLENGVVNLLNRLTDERFSHVVCCLTHAGKLAERINSKDIKIVELGLPTDRFRFPLFILRRLMRRWSPAVLHTRGWGTIDAVFAGRAAGVPRLIHGEHGREATDPEGLNRKRNLVRKCFSPLVDRFVAVSDDLRLWLTQTVGISPLKVVTIHNGVDLQKFVGDGRDDARRMLGLDSSTFVFGTVGRLDPVKDHGSLLQAFAAIARADRRAILVVVGDGPMRSQIESQVAELALGERVRLLGERPDVSTLLRAFDVFVLTSIAEGISNTILEAMASGLPIVATRVGGNPELVEHGISGHMVAARDVSGLTHAFRSYLVDAALCQRHGRAARERVVDKFSLERMAADYADLYLSLTVSDSLRSA